MIDSAVCNPCPTRGIQNIDMAQKLNVERMRVATPCHVGWDSMAGDDRARFCSNCKSHVYNIVGLSRGEIESLVQTTEGRLCVRMYQRADDTVLAQDCPVGLQAVRKRVASFAGAALSALLGLVSVGHAQKPEDCSDSVTKVVERVKIDSKDGKISGLIIDVNGAVVPGIEIKLQLKKKSVAKVTSDSEGNFTIRNIKPAENYTLRTDGQNSLWKKQVIKGITIGPGDKVSYSLCIQPGPVETVVGLFSQPSEIHLGEPTKPTETFSPREVYRLPITSKERSKPHAVPFPQRPEDKAN